MAEQAKIDLLIEGSKSARTLGELEENAEKLNQALKGAEIGSQEYRKLNDQLASTNRQVKNLELGFESLDNEQVASEIGSVAGAIGDVSAAMILMGGEGNESLEKMVRNIETALGVSMAFKGAIEGLSSAQKLYTNLVKRYSIVQAIANGATKAFNVILRANPIGLIVTAVGLLIGGIVLLAKKVDSVGEFFQDLGIWIKDTIDSMGAWKGVILALLGPIGWLIAAWDYFFGEQAKQMSEQEKLEQKRHERRMQQKAEITKAHNERLNQIKAEADAAQEAWEEQDEIYELEIDRMEAEGKNAFALKKAKQEATIENLETQLEAIDKLRESWVQYYEEQFELSGKSREDFIKQLKGRGINIEKLEEEFAEKRKNLEREIFKANTQLIKLERTEREKANDKKVEDEEETNEELLEAERSFQERRNEILKRVEEAENEFLNSKLSREQQEINAVRDKYFILIEEARKFGEDTAILEQAQQERITEIEKRYAQERADAAEREANKKREEQFEYVDSYLQASSQLTETANMLAQTLFQKDLKRAQAKVDAGQKLTKHERDQLERQAKVQKAFAVAQIVADTARGISGAIAAGAGIPFPGNLPAIASGIAAVVSGMVQATQAIEEPINIPTVSEAAPDISGEAVEQQAQNVPNTNAVEFGSTLLNQPQQVVVVEDINNGQNSVDVIEQNATFG